MEIRHELVFLCGITIFSFSFLMVVLFCFPFKSSTVALFKFRLSSSFYSISSLFLLLPWTKNNTVGKQLILDS